MARRNEEPARKPGFLFYTAVAFVAITLTGLVTAIFLILQPQSLRDIHGAETGDGGGRNVSSVLRESQQRQAPVTLTEEEINRWLARTLEVKQGGMFGMSLQFKQVLVRLTDGVAEVVMVRELAGRPFTVSMFISIHQVRDGDSLKTDMNFHAGHGRALPPILNGGRFGRLVVPQGFLRLIRPAYVSLAEVIQDELENGFSDMTVIRFEERQLVLDPRKPRRQSTAAPGELDIEE